MTDSHQETLTLYCCRYCGAFSSVKVGGCPVCDYDETEEYEENSLDGGTVTLTKPWYTAHEVVLS